MCSVTCKLQSSLGGDDFLFIWSTVLRFSYTKSVTWWWWWCHNICDVGVDVNLVNTELVGLSLLGPKKQIIKPVSIWPVWLQTIFRWKRQDRDKIFINEFISAHRFNITGQWVVWRHRDYHYYANEKSEWYNTRDNKLAQCIEQAIEDWCLQGCRKTWFYLIVNSSFAVELDRLLTLKSDHWTLSAKVVKSLVS